jgi:murein DD-endopeptidase MepM/ murein hydrolase activator NlpD
MPKPLLFLALLILSTLGIAPENHYAQTQCSQAAAVNYPFDLEDFTLAQAFGVPSPRHQGRYHTGEDWIAGRDSTLGLPVRAIAAGRVTYSFPLGWGRDGGVVIIEHTFADGTVVYSQYGHMMETDSIRFPSRLSCVEAGQVIGAIGSARPAPHLHFEIKLNGGDTPGPGYSWTNPYDAGWRDPSKFILNRQAWAHPAHRWHLVINDPAGFRSEPLMLDDHSLMYIDGQALKLATYDGRVLWRVLLQKPAIGVIGHQRQPLVVYADGTMQIVDYEGKYVDGWTLAGLDGKTLLPKPVPMGEGLLFQTSDGTLLAVSGDRREIRWKLENVPRAVHTHVTPQTIALLTRSAQLLLISPEGKLRDTIQLRGKAGFASASDGALAVFGRGGLWRVDANNQWSLLVESPRAENDSSALLVENEQRIFAFDGSALRRFEGNTEVWSLPLQLEGSVRMRELDGVLLLISAHGQILAVSDSGVLCGAAQVYGSDGALIWDTLSDDGVLRIGVGDQVLGMDWEKFVLPCQM